MPSTSLEVAGRTEHEIRITPAIKRKLLLELKTYASLKAQMAVLQAAIDKRKAVIGTLRNETGEQSLSVEGFKITLVSGVRSVLDPKKLIALGVSTAQIEEATVTKPVKPYEKISLPNEKEDE